MKLKLLLTVFLATFGICILADIIYIPGRPEIVVPKKSNEQLWGELDSIETIEKEWLAFINEKAGKKEPLTNIEKEFIVKRLRALQDSKLAVTQQMDRPFMGGYTDQETERQIRALSK